MLRLQKFGVITLYFDSAIMRNYNKINWNDIHKQLKQAKKEYWGCFNLSNYGLTEIPTEIFEIDSLCELDLSYNRFTNIPTNISQLTNVSYLILDSNQIETLPENLTQLPNLYELYLEENDLVSIPSVIFQLTSLTGLVLSFNQIESASSRYISASKPRIA